MLNKVCINILFWAAWYADSFNNSCASCFLLGSIQFQSQSHIMILTFFEEQGFPVFYCLMPCVFYSSLLHTIKEKIPKIHRNQKWWNISSNYTKAHLFFPVTQKFSSDLFMHLVFPIMMRKGPTLTCLWLGFLIILTNLSKPLLNSSCPNLIKWWPITARLGQTIPSPF